ncbi:MAG: hypothetical protein K8R02_06945 [Anaerohalosphaeraceae bacterium]|nr:hypothetical protein [Anaerohalosphaeraceae bacterium]
MKIRNIVLRMVIGILLTLCFWLVSIMVVHLSLGVPPIRHDIGNGYEVWGWPEGKLMCWKSKENNTLNWIINDPITKLALESHWIIGKTNKGWFAIDTETKKLSYPLSENDIEKMVSIAFSSIKILDDITPYAIGYNSFKIKKMIVDISFPILLIVLPVFLGFFPYLWKKLLKKNNESH